MEYSPCRGETPGPMGFGGDYAEQLVNHRMTEVQDYVLRHQLNSEGLAEATMLESHIFPFPRAKYRIWRLGDAVVFRRKEIQEDKDGSARAYHEPTDAFFDGRGPGFGTDSLLNAVSRPPAKGRFPVSEAAEKGKHDEGCQPRHEGYGKGGKDATGDCTAQSSPGLFW